jgi:hypothetical protein
MKEERERGYQHPCKVTTASHTPTSNSERYHVPFFTVKETEAQEETKVYSKKQSRTIYEKVGT